MLPQAALNTLVAAAWVALPLRWVRV